jgi:hypothetical protein
LIIDEVASVSGGNLIKYLYEAVFKSAGKDIWSLCFGAAFGMIRKDLVISIKQRLLLQRRLLRR